MIKIIKKMRFWSATEDALLTRSREEGALDYDEIAALFPERTKAACQHRYSNLTRDRSKVKKKRKILKHIFWE